MGAKARSFLALYLRGGLIIALDAVNRPQEFMFAKHLVGSITYFQPRSLLTQPAVSGTWPPLRQSRKQRSDLSMPTIILIDHNGSRREVRAEVLQSVMVAATSQMVPGIIGECGGGLCCATCHVYVEAGWIERLDPPSKDEREMIECAIEPASNSRLSCQIRMTEALDGLTLTLPRSQV